MRLCKHISTPGPAVTTARGTFNWHHGSWLVPSRFWETLSSCKPTLRREVRMLNEPKAARANNRMFSGEEGATGLATEAAFMAPSLVVG
jgi:hypothetical protein